MELNKDIAKYYNEGKEQDRLENPLNKFEKIRTLDILERYLPNEKLTIADIGGGAGVYSFILSELGHDVHLLDIVPLHVEQATELNEKSDYPLKSISVGDARKIPFSDNFADAVLLFGPMYHLTEKQDRLQALKECYRILKPGGLLFSAGISKYASLLDGFDTKNILDEEFQKIVNDDLKMGQHRNPTYHEHYFTTAYFHDPNELIIEHLDSGFEQVELLAIEGPLGLLNSITEFLESEEKLKILLDYSRKIEKEINLIGSSSHIMVIGKK